MYNEVDGDLIELAKEGTFDVIVQGNNCFNTQGSGLAPQMVKAFRTDTFKMESPIYKGDINKLGTIDYRRVYLKTGTWSAFEVTETDECFKPKPNVVVVNAYTQYNYGAYRKGGSEKPVDYDAITMVMRKINHIFKGKHIGLPRIGAGLAGGDWSIIKGIIQKELKDCEVTVVNYK